MTGTRQRNEYSGALEWLDLGGATDEDGIALCDQLARETTAEQIEEAQRLSRDWKPTETE